MNKHINKMASLYRHATLLTNINHNLFICILLSLALPAAREGAARTYDDRPNIDEGGRRLTREYHLRQGALRGLIVKPSRQYNLQHVEMFLGIPYAAPPTGNLRFMPPVSAVPWPGVKMATRLPPVCPQMLPVLKKGNPPSLGRQHYMNRLKAFLKNESEDCLYLNIYVPYREQKSKKFPVLVFVHGDSFEWGSGNPYDGRVLAAYGNVMVVTVNFRLGVLGFMKPSLTEHVYGNNGLLDQLAALQWIKDNIEDLDGDPAAVTLMGHGTGAACVNFLMMSPILSNGLFHRAILMSGSALSDWALTKDPAQYTLQVAQSLGCDPSSADLMKCLQNKPLSDIKKAQILAREFETALGPVVAGAFVPSEPAKTMEAYPNLLSKYQLLSGVTELESYHDFGVIELAHGMLETQRDDFVKKYVKLVFEGGEDVALKDILKQYSVQRGDPQRWSVESNTEFILNVFSDARAVAPLFKTVHYQSKANPRSYFYVFSHNSESTEHAALGKSVHGEELPYVLGVPLGGAETHFHSEYTIKEKLLSEAVMRLWTNFVKNGSPNTQSTRTNSKYNEYYTLDKSQWRLYNIDWPEYNVEHQSFLKLDIPPYVGSFYRSNYTRFWTEILPNKMKRYVVDPLFEFTHVRTTQKPKAVHRNGDTSRRNWNENTPPRSASTFYGRIKPHFPPPTHYNSEVNKETESISFPAKPVASDVFQRITTQSPTHNRHKTDENFPVKTSSTMMTLIILAIILFLLINIAVGTALYLKKKKLNSRQRNLESNINTQNRTRNNDKKEKEDKSALKTFKNGYSALKSMSINKMRSHSRDKKPKVEQCKTPKSDDSGGFGERLRLRRHLSTSTLDAHTKVRDWITNDVMHRCSPGFLRKSNSDLCNDTQITSHKPYTRSEELLSDTVKSKQILKQNISSGLKPHLLTKQSNDFKFKTSEKTTSTSAIGSHSSMEIKGSTSVNNNKKNIKSNDSLQSKDSGSVTSKKVSIAIDATPAARTNSILQQEPIEISKSFEKCEDDLKSTTTESNTLQKSKTDKVDDTLYKYKDKTTNVEDKNKIFTSIVSLPVSQDSLKGPLKISHKHSTSDPVTDVNYDEIIMKADFLPEKLTSIPPPALFGNEINVTSKEEKDYELLSPAEALLTIKRRNYPKVLPDFPSSQKRLSLQPSCQTIRSYINSLDNQIDIRPKLPPQPPPRTTTLERRLAYKNSKPLSSFGSSSNTLSQEGQLSQNYENIESLSSVEESYSPFNRKKEPFEQLNLSTFIKNREIPKVIIASSDVPDESRSKILITATPQRSSIDLPKYIPRVTLPDDFHSIPMNPFHSCTSSYSDDYDDTLGDEFLEDIADDKLIQELVGGVDSPTEIEEFLDTKGPDTDFPKNLEIVPVKVKTDVSQPRNEKDYIFISDLVLPDPSGSERTAQMKPHFTLNKADDRGESIQKPPEKTVKVKQKRSINPTAILSRAIKSKDLKAEPEKREGSNLYHSNSGSSNDTEASTGTVKRVIT